MTVFWSLVVVGNWSGYSATQRLLVLLAITPVILVDFAAFLVNLSAPADRQAASRR